MSVFQFPEQSNAGDWRPVPFEVIAGDDESPVDLDAISGLVVTLQIQPPSSSSALMDRQSLAYPPTPLVTATVANGMLAVSGSTIAINVPAASLRELRAGAYPVGMVMTDGTETLELLRAILPIVEGNYR